MNFIRVSIVIVLLIGVGGAVFGLIHASNEVDNKQQEVTKLNHERKPLLVKAKAGDMEAMYQLGLSYAQESQVQDYKQSRIWLKKAALLNHAKAQYFLGYTYANGNGVEKDPAEATVWFWLASSNEERNSRRYLKLMANLAPAEDLAKARKRASDIWETMPNKALNKHRSALKYH